MQVEVDEKEIKKKMSWKQVFGFSKKKMTARLSFTDFNGQEFMKNISQSQKIDQDVLLKYAPKIIEGVEKLKNWSESI